VAASLQAPILFLIAQDLGEMQVNANLDEADIGRIRLDQKALFTVDAFPGRMFEGRVSQIRKSPQTIQNVVTYTVIIAAGNPGQVLLPGMTATVRVVVDEKPSVLRVPSAALRFRPESNGAAAKPASGTDAGPERASASGTNKGPGTGKGPGAGSGQGRSSGAGGMPGVKTGRENGSETPLPGRVFLPGPDNRPIPVDVMTGLSDGDLTEILPGPLTEGQKVITGQTDPNKPQDRGRPSSPGGFRL
jgi:HlyD family secretion protein